MPEIQANRSSWSTLMTRLFDTAKNNGGLEYVFTLVRVDGLSFDTPDPLVGLWAKLSTFRTAPDPAHQLSQYCDLAASDAPLSLVTNLLNCGHGRPYNISPFNHLRRGHFPNIIEPTISQRATALAQMATADGEAEVARVITDAYPNQLLASCTDATQGAGGTNDSQAALNNLFLFLQNLLETYFTRRREFRSSPRFFKLPQFEVLELLVNDDVGIFGFRVHFSNRSSAEFVRHIAATICTNLTLGERVGFHVGSFDELTHEWRVGEKWLYEVGLPGRYNELGNWKPLVYPSDSQALVERARALSNDPGIQGALFYMMCTGHKVIEFAVRTSVDLPIDADESFGLSRQLQLWKCPVPEGEQSHGPVVLYDGNLFLEETDPESIRLAIDTIGAAMNRLAFAFGASIEWTLKYQLEQSAQGCEVPSKEELQLLREVMAADSASPRDLFALDAAIDWYNQGSSSKNIFTRFLCYYIALESLSTAVADGDADFGVGYQRPNAAERRRTMLECIEAKQNELLNLDPKRFIVEAYFECVLSLKKKTRCIVELVFGEGHPYVVRLFEKRDGYSLSDIRGRLAHGGFTLVERDDEQLVKARLPEIEQIAREFLVRLAVHLKPSDLPPTWSQRHRVAISMSDPRSTLCTSTLDVLPRTDWRIQPEWLD